MTFPKSIAEVLAPSNIISYYDKNFLERDSGTLAGLLFPVERKSGLTINMIKGKSGAPVELKSSAFDTNVMIRDRRGIESLETKMPFFKDSYVTDEELRQELNDLLRVGDQTRINMVLKNIYDDASDLLIGATASMERMRYDLLINGKVIVRLDGQEYVYDYGRPEENMVSDLNWADPSTANPELDIFNLKDKAEQKGFSLRRIIMNERTLNMMARADAVKKLFGTDLNKPNIVTGKKFADYLATEHGLTVLLAKGVSAKDQAATPTKYMPDGTFVLVPEGELGKTFTGRTPEEAESSLSKIADVKTDSRGVTLTSYTTVDPVGTQVKASMICLPTCPVVDQIYTGVADIGVPGV